MLRIFLFNNFVRNNRALADKIIYFVIIKDIQGPQLCSDSVTYLFKMAAGGELWKYTSDFWIYFIWIANEYETKLHFYSVTGLQF